MVLENRNPYKPSTHKNKLRTLYGWPWPLIYASVAFVVVLSIFLIGVPNIVRWRVKEETQFRNGTDTWKKLVNITIPLFMNIRIFNITNPDALGTGGKLKLQELGPYVYEERRIKNVTRIDEEEDTVTYFETKTYFFRADLSNGSESDLVNTINFPFLSASTIARKYFHGMSNLVIRTFEGLGESIILRNVPVRGLIFNGMDINPLYTTLTELAPRGMPQQFVGATFSYLNGRNSSHSGEYKIKSGIKDSSKLGNTVSWKGKEQLPFWTNASLPEDQQYCNKLNGSDGSLTPPFITMDRNLYIFYDLLCRSLLFKYNHTAEYEEIPSWQFTLPRDAFASPEKNPDNQCFCMNPGSGLNSQCLDGIYRAFTCYNDSPFVFSKPHFLDADPRLINGVHGLSPAEDIHGSMVEYEPISGMVLSASVKIQLVVELQPLAGVSSYRKVPHLFLPVMWIEQLAYLDEVNVDFIKRMLVIPMEIVEYAQWISFTFVGVLLLVAIIHTARKNLIHKTIVSESHNEFLS